MTDLVPVQVTAADLKPCAHCGEQSFAPIAEGLIVREKFKVEPDGGFGVRDTDPFIGWHCTNCGLIAGLFVGQKLQIVIDEQKAEADADLVAKTHTVMQLAEEEKKIEQQLIDARERKKAAEAEQQSAADKAKEFEELTT